MIKKYTFLIFVVIFLLAGVKEAYAVSETGVFFADQTEEQADSAFFRGETPTAFQNRQSGAISGDLSIGEQAVWAANGAINVQTMVATDVYIYTITGQLSKRLKVAAGETAVPVSRGLYIVRLGNIARKVVVR